MGILDYILGEVRIEAHCHSAERFLNICANLGVKFKKSEKLGADIVRVAV